MFHNFYLVKDNIFANHTLTTEATEKLRIDLESYQSDIYLKNAICKFN
jgi:hypothetical protein